MMASRKTSLKLIEPDLEQMEAAVVEAAQQQAPIVRRLATHRDRFDMQVKALENERADLVTRRNLLTRQYEAALAGLDMHISDIDETMGLYLNGMSAQGGA